MLIPHFGQTELLRNCLDSIAAQTRAPDEVLIFNNTARPLQLRETEWSFPVSIIESTHNQGFARAVNALANVSRSDLLLLLNNDAVLAQTCLAAVESGVALFPEHSSFALLVLGYSSTSAQPHVQSIGLMYTAFGFGNRSNSIGVNLSGLPHEVFCPCGAGAVYGRGEFLKLGGMNRGFFFGYEDLELGLRFRLAGHSCILLHDAIATHSLSASIRESPALKVRQAVRNSLWTLLARHPAKLFTRHAPTTWRFYSTWWCRLARAGYSVPVMLALLTVIVELPMIFFSRFVFWLEFSRHSKMPLGPLYDGPIEVYYPDGHAVIETKTGCMS